jgi:hypothetical protein
VSGGKSASNRILSPYLQSGATEMTLSIAECRPYHAQASGQSLLRMPDHQSVFKIYYLSVVGRDNPAQYEWKFCPLSKEDFEKALIQHGLEGIGFVTAFPHVTKIFRFSPYKETILDVSEFRTPDLQPLDYAHGDGTHEFACYAETLIAAAEYTAWAGAESVDQYLAFRYHQADFPVRSETKLAAYWNKG